MALIKCPECGKVISEQAVTCPNCGYPINKQNDARLIPKFVTVLFYTIFVISLIILVTQIVSLKENEDRQLIAGALSSSDRILYGYTTTARQQREDQIDTALKANKRNIIICIIVGILSLIIAIGTKNHNKNILEKMKYYDELP